MNYSKALVVSVAVLFSGCGGGSDASPTPAPASTPTPTPTPTPTTSAEGLWVGQTNTNRKIYGVVLDDGKYWFVYSAVGNTNVLGGAVQGHAVSGNGVHTSTNGIDFNLEGAGANAFEMSGQYINKATLHGTIKYSPSEQVSFSTAYDSDYELTPNITLVAGSYTGVAATSAGSEYVTLTVGSGGLISGSGASGCSFSGTASPRSRGNVFTISVTFGGGNCANGTSTVTGVAYYDRDVKELTSAALNASRTEGFIFVGNKP